MASFEKVFKDITQVLKEAPLYGEGVQLMVHVEPKDNTIVVDYIKIPTSLRRKGIASSMLTEVKDIADGHNVAVQIMPSTDFGTPQNVLFAFYINNGFTFNQGYFWYNR